MGKYTKAVRERNLDRVTPEQGDFQTAVEAYSQQQDLAKRGLGALAAQLLKEEAGKAKLEEQIKPYNVRIAALQQLIEKHFTDTDREEPVVVTDRTGALLGKVRVDDEVYVSVPDAASFYGWVKGTPFVNRLTLHSKTIESLVKERLLEGGDLPPGTAAKWYRRVRTW